MSDTSCYWRNKTEECDYLTVYTDELDIADSIKAKPTATYLDMKNHGKRFAVQWNVDKDRPLHKELVKKLHLTEKDEIYKEKRTRKRKEK